MSGSIQVRPITSATSIETRRLTSIAGAFKRNNNDMQRKSRQKVETQNNASVNKLINN